MDPRALILALLVASCSPGNIEGVDGTGDGSVGDGDGGGADAPFGLTAAPTGSPMSGDVALTVTFDGCGSSGEIVLYVWDFGDGDFAVGANPVHTFSAGVYDVVLTVVDAEGHQASASIEITVNAPPAEDLIVDGTGHPRLYFDKDHLDELVARIARVPILGDPDLRESYVDGYLLHDSAWQGAKWYLDNGGTGCSAYILDKVHDGPYRQIGDCLTSLALGAVLESDSTRSGEYADAAIAGLMRMATVWSSTGWETPGDPSDEWDAAGYSDADRYAGFGRWLCGACTTPDASNLQNGELLYASSVAFDLLFDRMTTAQQDAIRDLLLRETRHVYLKSQHHWTWWADDGNNWQAVIHGPLGLAGLVLKGEPGVDDAEADAWIARAKDQVLKYFDTNYDAAGVNYEDYGHAGYGLFYAADFLRALRELEGDDQLDYRNGVMHEALRYMVYATAPSFVGAMPNDGVDWGHHSSPVNLILSGLYRDGFGLRRWDRVSGESRPAANTYPWKPGGDGAQSVVVRTALLYDDSVVFENPAGRWPTARVYPDFGRALFRSAWDDPTALFLGVECGIYGSHGKPNQGHFFLTGYGEVLVDDIGSGGADFNLLRVDGLDQKSANAREYLASTTAQLISPSAALVRYDTTAAYEPALDHVGRDFLFVYPQGALGGYVVVTDRLEDAETHSIEWLLHTPDTLTWQPGVSGRYTAAGSTVDLEVIAAAGTMSHDAGRRELAISTSGADASLVTLLYPTDATHTLPETSIASAGSAEGFAIGTDRVLFNPEGAAFTDGDVVTDAGLLLARSDSQVTVAGARSLEVAGARWLAANAPVQAAIHVEPGRVEASVEVEEAGEVQLVAGDSSVLVVLDSSVHGPFSADGNGLVTLPSLSVGQTHAVLVVPAAAAGSCP